jgi:hypothetical protein
MFSPLLIDKWQDLVLFRLSVWLAVACAAMNGVTSAITLYAYAGASSFVSCDRSIANYLSASQPTPVMNTAALEFTGNLLSVFCGAVRHALFRSCEHLRTPQICQLFYCYRLWLLDGKQPLLPSLVGFLTVTAAAILVYFSITAFVGYRLYQLRPLLIAGITIQILVDLCIVASLLVFFRKSVQSGGTRRCLPFTCLLHG